MRISSIRLRSLLLALGAITTIGAAGLPATASADRFTEVPTSITAPGMQDIAATSDGKLWISARSKGSLLAVQSDGRVAEWPITGLGRTPQPEQLASDARGSLWSSDPSDPVLVRSSQNGASVDIPTGDAGSRPVDLATGADGNVWFTTAGKDRVGKVTPDGDLTLFPTASRPVLIAPGTDGGTVAWFTTDDARVGRVGSDGSTATIATVPGGPATALVQSPDGNVWVATAQSVSRVTPGGDVSTFTEGLPAGAGITDLAAAANGCLWFTAPGARAIGRVTPEGTITVFATKNAKADGGLGATPQGLAMDSSGRPTYFGQNADGLIAAVVGVVDPVGVPTGSAGPAEEIETKSATLPAVVNPEAGSTTVSFEYGITMTLGKTSESKPLEPGLTPQAVRIGLTDLDPKRTYFYRVVATNSAGTFKGPYLQFTTQNVPLPTTPPLPGKPTPSGGSDGKPDLLPPASAGATMLRLAGPAAKLGKKGIVKLKLSCPVGAACEADLQVTAKLGKGKRAKSVVIAKKAVAVGGGKTANVGLRINAAGQKAIRRAGKKGLSTLAVFAVGKDKARARLTLSR